MEKEVVKIGNKSTETYIQSALFALNKCGRTKIRGLGSRQNKLLKVFEFLKDVDNIVVVSKSSITAENSEKTTPGLEIVLEMEGDR